jgi:hypothetical protein
VEPDVAGHASGDIDLGRQDFGVGRQKEDIVESERVVGDSEHEPVPLKRSA